MLDQTRQLRLLFGVCACLLLSGCFQGYGQNVNSPAELDTLLMSLTPNSNSATTMPLPQASPPPTSVPTLPPATNTNAPIIVEGGTIIHIVAPGDTLFEIAQKYNVTVELLSALNGISDPNALFVEQALIIPPTNTPEGPVDASTETSMLPTESVTPFPTATATLTSSPTPLPTATASPTDVPTFTPLPTDMPSLTPSFTPLPTDTLMPTATPVILATVSPEPTEETELSLDGDVLHVVQTGQTLFQISQQYNVSLETIAEVNGIEDASQVTIGQELRIPVPNDDSQDETTVMVALSTVTETVTPTDEVTALSANGETIHVVQRNETLYQISLNYSVSLESLTEANDILDPNRVRVGDELIIPLATPSSPISPVDTTVMDVPSPQRITYTNIPTQVNGIGVTQIVQLSPQAESTILDIYQRGQEMGRNPRAFSKLGDSTIENPHFLARFDNWEGFSYDLGDYVYLQNVIDYYAGSFIRQGAAVRRGMHSWTVFDPQWADKSLCQAGESALACEFRLHNPSILLIRLGANDVGVPQAFENNMRDVLDFSIENGVIPILGTKADRNDGASNPNNQIIRRLAEEYQLPLWDFDRLADTLPRRGLTTDGIHMSINFSHDYTDPNTFLTGHGANNLSALILLDILWQTLNPDLG